MPPYNPTATELRPVGTMFKMVLPSWSLSRASGNAQFRVITYRVIGHVRADNGPTEQLEQVALDVYPSAGWRQYCGTLVPIPPAEILPLLLADWHAPIDLITPTQGTLPETVPAAVG